MPRMVCLHDCRPAVLKGIDDNYLYKRCPRCGGLCPYRAVSKYLRISPAIAWQMRNPRHTTHYR